MRLPWQQPEQPKRPAYADYETLISDRRVHTIQERLMEAYRTRGLSDDTDFVTFVQPPTAVKNKQGVLVPIAEVAVFAVISDNPRHPGHRVMTQASVWLRDWLAKDAARLHFVSGTEDPAYPIFHLLVREQIEKLKNLKEMI